MDRIINEEDLNQEKNGGRGWSYAHVRRVDRNARKAKVMDWGPTERKKRSRTQTFK